jgi:hypothetical protein
MTNPAFAGMTNPAFAEKGFRHRGVDGFGVRFTLGNWFSSRFFNKTIFIKHFH